ncbi:hypothetical protein D918_06831 [Trichuris suis]|nr:hypothetical protein D918_06831 [Trichuris suis]
MQHPAFYFQAKPGISVDVLLLSQMDCNIAAPHLNSFNNFLEGIPKAISNPIVGYPTISKDGTFIEGLKLLPYECRCRGITYKSKLSCAFRVLLNGTTVQSSARPLMEVPIMVRSRRCYLEKMTPEQLVMLREEEKEFGGYFIINGVEKPIAINRPKWATLGPHYTPYGIYLRCVLEDHTAALLEASDRFIFDELLQGTEDDNSWRSCVTNMLMDLRAEGISSQTDALKHIGEMLRIDLQAPAFLSDAEIGQQFVDDVICVHLEKGEEKFNFLVYKLCALVRGDVLPENLDNPACQEILLPGTVLLMLLKFMWT